MVYWCRAQLLLVSFQSLLSTAFNYVTLYVVACHFHVYVVLMVVKVWSNSKTHT